MISRVGAVVVLAGNKVSAAGTQIPSSGVEEEVQIALSLGKPVIPIGMSGHVAHDVWLRAMNSPQEYLPGLDCAAELKVLGDSSSSVEHVIAPVSALLERAERSAAAKT